MNKWQYLNICLKMSLSYNFAVPNRWPKICESKFIKTLRHEDTTSAYQKGDEANYHLTKYFSFNFQNVLENSLGSNRKIHG